MSLILTNKVLIIPQGHDWNDMHLFKTDEMVLLQWCTKSGKCGENDGLQTLREI